MKALFPSSLLAMAIASPSFAESRPPQFVVFAFDGSLMLSRWEDTIRYARDLRKAQASDFGFTYFVSGTYFLSQKNKSLYKGPHHSAGQSDIGFSDSAADILKRIDFVNQADEEGNEIGSHANGHFHAEEQKWSQGDWENEFGQFNSLVFDNVYKNNGFSGGDESKHAWRPNIKENVIGFRAPYLEMTPGLWPALVGAGFKYDTSRTDSTNYWPKKLNGIWNFPLGEVTIAGTGKKTLSMDYNFYYAQSKGENESDPDKCKTYENQMYNTYVNYFTGNYNGNRAPVNVGHHFSLWNKGAYWNAMKRFAEAVCGKPEVRCVTFRELQQNLETYGVDKIAQFQKGNFPKAGASNPILLGTNIERPLELSLAVDQAKGGILTVDKLGSDAAGAEIRWEADGRDLGEAKEVDLARLPEFHSSDRVRLSAVAYKDGREVQRATRSVIAYPSNRADQSADFELSTRDLEERGLLGDMAGAHQE
jgi:hypothetical protein